MTPLSYPPFYETMPLPSPNSIPPQMAFLGPSVGGDGGGSQFQLESTQLGKLQNTSVPGPRPQRV